MLMLFSCIPENITQKPVINVSSTSLGFASEGSTEQVVYNIANPVADSELSVTDDADWLDVCVRSARLIEVTASKNEHSGDRVAKLVLSYPGADDVEISVIQSQWQQPILLTVLGTESTSVNFSVKTYPDDMLWVGLVGGKEWFDGKESDEDIFQEDLSYFSLEASNKNIPLSEYLSTIVNKGSYESLSYKGLDPDSDYVVYAYGITLTGERTTDIYHVDARTLPPYDGPMTFTIDVTEENNIMDITVTPDHDGVFYYFNLMDRATYDEYSAVCGDDPTAVFQAYVDWHIQDLVDYGYVTGRSEYYDYYSNKNRLNSQLECIALTEYILFASKWDEDCRFEGEPAYVWHTSADVQPSDNVITVSVSDADQSSFFVDVKTTNDDSYVMLAEPSENMAGMTDDEIYQYIMTEYGTWGILSYVFEGDLSGRMTGLLPDTEYTLVVYGYKAGKQTTSMQKFNVKTLSAGPAEDCRFDFVLNEAKCNSLDITVSPTDAAHYYYWYVYTTDVTADQVKQNILDLKNNYYYGDMGEFAYYELSQGKSQGVVSFLAPETEYKVAAVVMDYDSGEFLADVIFSEPFKTTEAVYADITVSLTYDKFYNGDELCEIDSEYFAQYAGYAMVPVTLTVEGDYKSYHYTIFEYTEGLDDESVVPDANLYESLVMYGVYWSEKVNFRAPWKKPVMLAAMAVDDQGYYSKVYRQKVTFQKWNAADPDELLGTKSGSSTLCVPLQFEFEAKDIKVDKFVGQRDDRFSADAVAKIKHENRIRIF